MSVYKSDPCFHDAIVHLKDYVEKFSNEDNLEVEIRLGYLEDDEFKTNIGKEFFNKITTQLEDCEVWESVTNENSEDYFYNGRRLSITTENPKGTCIKKEKLGVFDFMFDGSGFDIRVSFSKETPSKRYAKDKASYKRNKERTRYLFKNSFFDTTKVTVDDNGVEDNLYEIEIETKKLNLKETSSHYFIHDALLKIRDVVKMCEDIDESESKIIFMKEKIF
jgi:hypothetical protein